MTKTPIAAPHTKGSHSEPTGQLSMWQRYSGLTRAGARCTPSEQQAAPAKVNQNYIRTVSARHLPTSVSLIFMRLEDENCWYASLCFADADNYLPWREDVAERWLRALFGEDRPRLIEDAGTAP